MNAEIGVKNSHSLKEVGILTYAFGEERYLDYAVNLALSLRLHMPDLKRAIVTDRENAEILAAFDLIIPFNAEFGWGVAHKTYMDRYSPFDETLFIDADCLVSRPFPEELQAIRQFDFTPAVEEVLTPQDSNIFFHDLGETMRRLKLEEIPKFNGGVYFFRNGSEKTQQMFSEARKLTDRCHELGLRGFRKTGPNDESVFSLALSRSGFHTFYRDQGRLMRTPLGMHGPLAIDVMGGGTRFVKLGILVQPAICHFCGGFVNWVEYRGEALKLRTHFQISEASALDRWSIGCRLVVMRIWVLIFGRVVSKHELRKLKRRLKRKLKNALRRLILRR
jgi:hypothetical protein